MSGSASTERSSGPVGGGTRVVRQGECLYSIAEAYGLTWQKVWDHPDNRELRERRGNPGALLPGDRLAIPAREAREVPGATAQRHRFERKQSPATLKLRILAGGEPRVGLACELTVDGCTSSGTTDSDGRVEFTIAPTSAGGRFAIVEGGSRTEIELAIGHLDPWDTISGAQGRLRNLGYDPGPIDGALGPRTRSVVLAFQRARALPITGDLDRNTLETLKEVHGA